MVAIVCTISAASVHNLLLFLLQFQLIIVYITQLVGDSTATADLLHSIFLVIPTYG